MNRTRKSLWMAAAVMAVAMVAGSAVVASADGIGIPLPVDSEYGERAVGLGHNQLATLDLGDLRRWLPAPLAAGLPMIGRLPIMGFEEWGMPVTHVVVTD